MPVEPLRHHSPPRPAEHPDTPPAGTGHPGTQPVSIRTTEASRALADRAMRTGRSFGASAAAQLIQARRERARAASASALAAASPAERHMAERLDQFMQKMSGPYQVDGKQVAVPPAFRMNGGMGQFDSKHAPIYGARIARALPPKVYRKLKTVIGTVTAGKGTPDELRRVTQALIDSPGFDPYKSMPPKQAVRELMWHFGIGMDCSGYVHRAFLYSRGKGNASAPASKYRLGTVLASNIQQMPTSAFERVSPSAARAGDIVVLTNGPDGTGHKLIVHDRERLAPDSAMHRVVEQGLGSSPTARIDLYHVDSSWGAGGVPEQGGVKREVWARDESSGKWATLVKGDSGRWYAFASHKSGPYDHDLKGIYRPKAEM